jgi:hypothetical protein
MSKGYMKKDADKKKMMKKDKVTPAKAEFWEDVDKDADKMDNDKMKKKRTLST